MQGRILWSLQTVLNRSAAARKEKARPGYGGRDISGDNRPELCAQFRKVGRRPNQRRGDEDHRAQ